MQEILLGTIGSGVIVRSILDCVMKTPGIRPVAVYSRTRQRGEALASDYGIGKVYTDPDAFLAGQFSSRMEAMLSALSASDTGSTSEASGPATSTVSTGTALPEDTTLARPMSFIELSFAVERQLATMNG